jgi:translation initiation factor 2A
MLPTTPANDDTSTFSFLYISDLFVGLIVGLELSKSALKNKKKREASKQQHQSTDDKKSQPNGAPSQTTPAPVVPESAADKEKRIKSIEKKLKSIAGIKEAMANGQSVEDGQKQKVQTEAALLEELSRLKI